MSLDDLLSKINTNIQVLPQKTAVVAISPGLNLRDYTRIDTSTLPFVQLLELLKEVCSWLETHEALSESNNALDVNGRSYNPVLYEQNLLKYEEITLEILRRPVEEGVI